MKPWSLVVLLVCAVTAGYAQGTNDPDAASKIIALERIGKLQACENKDLRTLDALLDKGFVYVDPEGRLLTKPEVLAYVQMVNALHFTTDTMVVKVHGDTAIVTGLYRMNGADRGKAFSRRGRFVDTWLYKSGRWVAIASLSTPITE